jgi:hypothetical protein
LADEGEIQPIKAEDRLGWWGRDDSVEERFNNGV